MFTCCCTEATDKAVEIKIGDDLQEDMVKNRTFVKSEPAITEQEEEVPEEQLEFTPEFQVELDVEQEENIGISVDTTCEAFPIIRSVAGSVDGGKGASAKPYDRILRIDDQEISSSSEVQKLNIAGKKRLQLTLQRPVERDVVLKRPGSLGVTINYKNSTMGLVIVAIPAGLLANWNQANPQKAVKPFDRVSAVDGQTGTPELLCDLMRGGGDTIVLTILSYA
eukprot:TRINITY_DN4743_c0_g1_i2.p1 TRINITY_DN4743_c0_g1~~TRINITY_DN4743_c0_g1_i2.p1  ORF type:complete len:223 (+),score=57.43 TRINITY_DN4743_c0_g1_i2:97-765(+)